MARLEKEFAEQTAAAVVSESLASNAATVAVGGHERAEQTALLSWVVEFVAQKNWEGCQGLKLTDEMKLLIAANAGLLVLGAALATSDQFYFPDVRSVLVYPEPFVAPQRTSIVADCIWRVRHI